MATEPMHLDGVSIAQAIDKGIASQSPGTSGTPGVMKQGVAVANAAGANTTGAEFNALLVSLRNAGLIASS